MAYFILDHESKLKKINEKIVEIKAKMALDKINRREIVVSHNGGEIELTIRVIIKMEQ